MKELLIWVLAIAIGVLWYDDNSKRTALEQVQQQVDSVTAERDQLRSQMNTQQPPGTPDWFEQRLSERPTALDHH
jgi:hypothetical protein